MRVIRGISALLVIMAACAASPAAHAMAKPRNSPSPVSPVAGANAIQCGALYFTTGPQLGNWKGELRGGCHESGFCEESGKLHVVVDPDAPNPGAITINFRGKGKLKTETCEGAHCRHSRVGSTWYEGELMFEPWTPENSSFISLSYRRKDQAEDVTSDLTGQLAQCRWVPAIRP